MKLDFLCRVHTVNPADQNQDEQGTKIDPPRLPPSVVVLDTETLEGLALDFEFGCYAYCELVDGSYVSREEGILFHDDLKPEFTRVIREYAECPPVHLGELAQAGIRVRSRTDFVKNVFWPTLRVGGAAVGLNLGFDLSRISIRHSAIEVRVIAGTTELGLRFPVFLCFKFFTRDYLVNEAATVRTSRNRDFLNSAISSSLRTGRVSLASK